MSDVLSDWDSVATNPTKTSSDVLGEWDSLAQPKQAAAPKPIGPPQNLSWVDRALAHLPDWMAQNPADTRATVARTLGASVPGRAVMGAMDMGTGAVQLAAHATPGVDASAVDQRIGQFEKDYEGARGPDAGVDLPRIGGNVAAAVALPSGAAAEGSNLINRLISAGFKGGLPFGLAQPVTDAANFWTEKAKQGGLGIVGGVVGQGVMEGVGKVAGGVSNWAYNSVKSLFGKNGDLIPAAAQNASPALQDAIRTQVKQGGKVDPTALARQVEADSLPVPVSLTRGQAIQDPVAISTEMNTRGIKQDMVYKLKDQNDALAANLHAIRQNVAPDAVAADPVVRGEKLITSLRAADDAEKANITSLYQKLKDANGGKFPVDGIQFVDNADKALGQEMKSPFLPSEVRGIMDDFVSGKRQMTFENFENLRTILATAGRKADRSGDGNASGAINIVRNALEDLPMSGEAAAVKPLADAARQAARDRFNKIAETPALKDVVNGKETADTFIQKHIIGGTKKGLTNLAAVLKDDPEALQHIKAGVVDSLEKSAMGQSGNFSQAGYNRVLESLKPKLGMIFSPDEINTLQTLGNVARYTQIQPRGSFVNNSNTDVANLARSKVADIIDATTRTPIAGWINRAIPSGPSATTSLREITNPAAGAVAPGPAQQFLTRALPVRMGNMGAVPLASLASQYPDESNKRPSNR